MRRARASGRGSPLKTNTSLRSASADRYSVGVLVLAIVFLLTIVVGAALAKGLLTLMLGLIVEGQLPAMASIRTVAAGLFALVR